MDKIVWLLPLVSGLLDAASRGAIKMTKVHRLTLVAGGYLFAIPFYIVLLAVDGIPVVAPLFWVAIATHVPLLIWANILIVESHRLSSLTLTMPVQGLTPAFLLVISPLFFLVTGQGGLPTWLGGFGVLALTVGLYILNIQSGKIGFFAPVHAFWSDRGVRLMFWVALIFAVTSNLDYLGFTNSSAAFFLLVDHGLAGIATVLLAIGYWRFGKNNAASLSPHGSWKGLAFYGVFIAFSAISQVLAYYWIPVVPYVIAGKRAGSIIFAVLLGLFMGFVLLHKDFLKEREDLKYRLPGTAVAIIGMLIIILWGKS